MADKFDSNDQKLLIPIGYYIIYLTTSNFWEYDSTILAKKNFPRRAGEFVTYQIPIHDRIFQNSNSTSIIYYESSEIN
jgi:hypothetical protein